MKKDFGQNLLVDNKYLNNILESLELSKKSVVFEIGSGSGILTNPLSRGVKKVYAIEVERDIIKSLQNNIGANNLSNVQVVENSILKIDFLEYEKDQFSIVGNIPYNITSKIILKIFGEIGSPSPHISHIEDIYLMVQYEVAERLCATKDTKAYSPISLLVGYYAEAELLFKVPASAFSPKPKVDSAFIRLKPKKNYLEVSNANLLKTIIRTVFQQRRKKIVNGISRLAGDKKLAEEILKTVSISKDLRPENLSLEDYIQITNEMIKLENLNAKVQSQISL